MNEDIDNDKDYQIMELKQRISYYEPYKQKYEDLKEDWKYIKSLLDKEFNERTRLKKENEQLKEEYKIAVDEMVTDYKKLEKENEQLQKDVENLQEVVAELGATLLLNGFEIKINDENLSELIDDE